MRGIINKLIKRFLFHLLLVLMLLNHQNPFSMLLFQHILIDVENVMNQTISVKTAQSLKSTNQLKLKRLSLSLTISFSVKILKYNISAIIMMMIFQKMI